MAAEPAPASGELPRRPLGRTGMKVSVVGFPGLALAKVDQEQCTAGLHRTFDRGVNFFDVAPAYGNGDAEIKMGIGLQGLDRGKLFVIPSTFYKAVVLLQKITPRRLFQAAAIRYSRRAGRV